MLKIFAGYIFIFFHIKINGFDLLANFIGYILVYQGLISLSDRSASFLKAKPWVLGMGIFEFAVLIGSLFGILPNMAVLVILNYITIFISLYILYLIDNGINEIEQNTGLWLNSAKIMSLWKYQAVLTIGASLFTLVPSGLAVILSSLLALASIIADIIFLVYLYRAGKTFNENNESI